ncbi:ribonuclease H-like domain, reverse transcriptase, RNA-dependent DNA polymerase, partial [Tanacetum coccineum]
LLERKLEVNAQKHLGTVPENNSTSTPSVNSGSEPVNTDGVEEPKKIFDALQDDSWVQAMQEELFTVLSLQQVWVLVDLPQGMKVIGTKWVYRNKRDERGVVVRNKARLVAQGHRQEEGIDYDEVFAPVAKMEAIRLFLAFASFMGFIVYQMDVKKWHFLYGTIGMKRLLLKTAIYNMETKVAFGKDKEAVDVDVHLYKIHGLVSLMYLLPLGADIMFCWIVLVLVSGHSKTSHLNAVKRIFKYLKGKPNLGLWYPIESPFDLEAFSDSDYGGSNLDRKSTTGGC